MTCCFSVGHFHIYLPLANYVCYASYLAVPSIIVENKNCFNISLCSQPNYKRDCEEWNLKLHFFTAPWTATTIQLKNHRNEKNSPRGCFLVPVTGLEPVRSQWPRDFKSLVSAYSTTPANIFGDPDENRTRVTAVKGRCLNRLTTGPNMVAEIGLEPTTLRVWTECSSQLSYSAM